MNENIETIEPVKTEEEHISYMFFSQLQEARELISAEGGDIGLCPYCQDTGFSYIIKDDYSGIEARIENDIAVPVKCFHGESVDDLSLGF
jgi:tartrate dehydratase alpha subunit/fumarate hydratase class I-like protein